VRDFTRVIEEHPHPVICIATSADGRLGVSFCGKVLKVWTSGVGRLCIPLRHSTAIPVSTNHTIALSADGRRAASSSGDVLEVWDLEAYRSVLRLKISNGSIAFVAMSGDGRRVSAGVIKEVVPRRRQRSVATWDEDDRDEFDSGWRKSITVWDVDTGNILRETRDFRGHWSQETVVIRWAACSHSGWGVEVVSLDPYGISEGDRPRPALYAFTRSKSRR